MSWNIFARDAGKQYDENKRLSAGRKAVIYYLAALYIGYMGYSILNNRLAGDDTMSYPLAVILTALLVIGAIFVAWYATISLKKEFKQSELEPAGKEERQD
jgi:arginine exporter protein ArgO